MIVGDIEDSGRLPGRIKLAGLGAYPKALEDPGMLKSVTVGVNIHILNLTEKQALTVHFIIHYHSCLWYHQLRSK